MVLILDDHDQHGVFQGLVLVAVIRREHESGSPQVCREVHGERERGKVVSGDEHQRESLEVQG